MYFSLIAAENVLKTDLQLEGATLRVQPKLSTSSRHQSTWRYKEEDKDQESQIYDQNSNVRNMEQGTSEPGEELRVDAVGGDRLTLDLNPHHSHETYVKGTKREECHGREEQTYDSTSTSSSKSGG